MVLCAYIRPSFLLETFKINHACSIIFGSHVPRIGLEFMVRCILVDENDRVVGHESKYNCKSNLISSIDFLEASFLVIGYSFELG